MKLSYSNLGLAAALVGSLAGNGYLFHAYRHAEDSNPTVQTARIMADLKKTTTLPDETPSIVTVVDRTKLMNAAIARDAQNGDKILFFQHAAKAVIYRPSTHKLVSMLSLAHSNASATPMATLGPTPPSKSTTTVPSPSPLPKR